MIELRELTVDDYLSRLQRGSFPEEVNQLGDVVILRDDKPILYMYWGAVTEMLWVAAPVVPELAQATKDQSLFHDAFNPYGFLEPSTLQLLGTRYGRRTWHFMNTYLAEADKDIPKLKTSWLKPLVAL